MKQYMVLSFALFTLLFSNMVLAGSVMLNWQVLDSYIRPNGETTILLTLSNPSTTTGVNTVKLYISSGLYLTPSTNYLELGGIGTSSSQQTSFTVKANAQAVSMVSSVSVKATYYDDSTYRESTVNIPITIKKEPLLQIENVTYDNSLEPGNAVNMLFDLLNAGDGSAKDVNVALSPSSVFTIIGSNEILVSQLNQGERTKISFPIRVNPDAAVGISTASVVLTYKDETKKLNYTVSKSIGMSIIGGAELVVAVEETKNLYLGNPGTVTISISNIGTGAAKFLTVKASSDFGAKESYIGNLNPDDEDSIVLEQNLARAKGPYNISLEMTYKDEYNNRFSETKSLQVIPPKEPFRISRNMIIIVLAAAGIWYWKRRKKK